MTINTPLIADAEVAARTAGCDTRRRQPGWRNGPALTFAAKPGRRAGLRGSVNMPPTASPVDLPSNWASRVTLTTAPTSGAARHRRSSVYRRPAFSGKRPTQVSASAVNMTLPPERGASDMVTRDRDIDLGDSCNLTADELRVLAERAGHELDGASATDIMDWGFARFGRSLAVTASMADTVMVHLAERTAPGLDVIFLDTGYHFVETIGTRNAVEDVYDVNLITVRPELSVAEQDERYGRDLFARNPDLCCRMRKVEPLGRALEPYTAWATGVRRADSPQRSETPVVDFDETRQMVKIAPLAAWSDEQVADYIDQHSLLTNPLLADGYPSIGCEPCTSRPANGSDPRSGRWAGRGKTECGIQL